MTNKSHLADNAEGIAVNDLLVQGVNFAEILLARVEEVKMPCRIIPSRDPDWDENTIRFFVRREGQPWGAENVRDYSLEEVVQWDVG